ncbi:hypothetical protein SXCC_00196 [Gluconacetobacter sp. SXCC-1]|jgi:hypothetical protein|nr:hypothetical protein SXCC_00196 [Gluconacetobacter sp. SXCC-1]
MAELDKALLLETRLVCKTTGVNKASGKMRRTLYDHVR